MGERRLRWLRLCFKAPGKRTKKTCLPRGEGRKGVAYTSCSRTAGLCWGVHDVPPRSGVWRSFRVSVLAAHRPPLLVSFLDLRVREHNFGCIQCTALVDLLFVAFPAGSHCVPLTMSAP